MIPLMKIGIVTGKTERQIASWLKSGWFPYLLILPDNYRLGDLLPADDPLDENGDGDREDGEADRQLVEERHSCEEVRSCQAFLLLKLRKVAQLDIDYHVCARCAISANLGCNPSE